MTRKSGAATISEVVELGYLFDPIQGVVLVGLAETRNLGSDPSPNRLQPGIRHEETLTGFKWISRVEGLQYGYEEALGYCVDPARVRDKDGVSACLLMAELAATLKADGRTLGDLLDELAVTHGVHATDSFSVRVADLSLIGTVMSRLRDEPPSIVTPPLCPASSAADIVTGAPEAPLAPTTKVSL